MSESLKDFNNKLKIAMNMPVREKEPYITMNKLAEYMQADATRRRQIVKNLKKDRDFTKVYYSRLKNEISKYFNSGYDNSILDKIIKELEAERSHTDWVETDQKNTILASKALKDTILPDLTDYHIVTDLPKLDHVILAGLKVTLKPKFYFRNIHSEKVGALKIHIAKTEKNRLNMTGMQAAATLLKYGFISAGFAEKDIDNRACISLDIFEKHYGEAPNAYKRTISALEASCEEILLRWDSV